jgi:serine/threonine protein kinase
VLALEYLQQQNVTHRDLKPGNVMMDQNNYLKLIDFGEAKIVDNYDTSSSASDIQNMRRMSHITISDGGQSSFFGRLNTLGGGKNKYKRQQTFVGTPMYCAPEMLEHNLAGLFTDLWALGCIMYELSSGKKMFHGKNN